MRKNDIQNFLKWVAGFFCVAALYAIIEQPETFITAIIDTLN